MNPTLRQLRWWLVAASCLMLGTLSHAFEFSGEKTVTAHLRDGRTVAIGTLTFTPLADGQVAFALNVDHGQFQDHFLSMREFKCLEGVGEIACHVPYPHAQPRRIRAGDLAWLEHNLLFMFKQPADFGAKLWNGMYFRLSEQGPRLVGTPEGVDLNAIAAPPVPAHTAPFQPDQRSEMTRGQRWLDHLVIE
jgi:hypothetical protein